MLKSLGLAQVTIRETTPVVGSSVCSLQTCSAVLLIFCVWQVSEEVKEENTPPPMSREAKEVQALLRRSSRAAAPAPSRRITRSSAKNSN